MDICSFICSDGWTEIPPLFYKTLSSLCLLPKTNDEEKERQGGRSDDKEGAMTKKQ